MAVFSCYTAQILKTIFILVTLPHFLYHLMSVLTGLRQPNLPSCWWKSATGCFSFDHVITRWEAAGCEKDKKVKLN